MTFLPDESIHITEKSGELIHFKNGEKIRLKAYQKFMFEDKVLYWILKYILIIMDGFISHMVLLKAKEKVGTKHIQS